MSEDEFDDFGDLELNEESLKALQDTEDRYTLTVAASQTYLPNPALTSSVNLQFTTAKLQPKSRHIPPTPFDADDTPDITVAPDGTYAVSIPSPNEGHKSLPNQQMVSRFQPTIRSGPSQATKSSTNRRTAAPSVAEPQQSNLRPLSRSLSKTLSQHEQMSSQGNDRGIYGTHITPMSDSLSSLVDVPRLEGTRSAHAELEALRAQLHSAQVARDAVQRQLEEARQAKFVRDGEVTTLRRTMEKQAANHSEALAQLRVEKLEAESRKAAIEADMNAEIDRLKTRFAFRQQEFEMAAIRATGAPPSTARRSRYSTVSQQPTPGPSRFNMASQSSKIGMLHSFGSSPGIPATPLSSRAALRKISSSQIDPIPFPGFHDSFAQRGTKSSRKGKGNDTKAYNTPLKNHAKRQSSPLEAFSDPFTGDDFLVSKGEVNAELEDRLEEEEGSLIAPTFAWSHELCRIVFSCSIPASKDTVSQLALQVLFSAAASLDSDPSRRAFEITCAEVLILFGQVGDQAQSLDDSLDPSHNVEYNKLVAGMGRFLLCALDVLVGAPPSIALLSALYLMTTLILMLPSFSNLFFTSTQPRPVLEILLIVLDAYIPEVGDNSRPDVLYGQLSLLDCVGAAAFNLLEVLAWNVADAQCLSLSATVQSAFLSRFLKSEQPFWLQKRTIRLFGTISIRSQLSTVLIVRSPVEQDSETAPVHFIERMCEYLADPGILRRNTRPISTGSGLVNHSEVLGVIQAVLTFFATLCTMHNKAMHILEHFPCVVPSLILCLADVANRLWDDDEFAEAPASDHDALLDVLVPGLQLLHYLLYGQNNPNNTGTAMEVPSFADLPHILLQATTQAAFGGALDHVYIVTMTRLGYADVPEWLGDDRVRIVDDVAELARELLELFVGGPEGDLIVEAYAPNETEHRSSQRAVARDAGAEAKLGDEGQDFGEETRVGGSGDGIKDDESMDEG